ncbi:MAG: class I SAM-dependent methyltransferase [Burkholderiales bacterium]|nr:class I SAM-dependent methyltransferase [Flavobacterium sp.]
MLPSQKDPLNYLVNIIFERKFEALSQKYLNGKMIDIGCGEKPYKTMLAKYIGAHIGVDHHDCSHDQTNIDLFGSAYSIPVDNNSFDSAICTAVLEHLEEPEQAIRECFRVLKNDGFAIYSVPFIWHLHEEPRDFFRYSTYGLQHLFQKSGFKIIEIAPLSGFAVTFIQLHLYLAKGKLDKGLFKTLGIFKAYLYLCTKLGLFLHQYDNSKQLTWMYTVVAQKTATPLVQTA